MKNVFRVSATLLLSFAFCWLVGAVTKDNINPYQWGEVLRDNAIVAGIIISVFACICLPIIKNK
jgi:hypothetical protein